MQVSVISDYAKCDSMVKDLKLAAGKFKQCVQMNTLNLLNPSHERITIRKKKCCKKLQTLDAEKFYKGQLEDLMYKIRIEDEYQSSENLGMCFVVFKDGEIAKKMLDTKWLAEQIKAKVKSSELRALGLKEFVVRKAYLESDIIWVNLKSSQFKASIKRVVFFLALVVFSLILLTPTYAIELLKPIKTAIERQVDNETLNGLITSYFAPIITLTINFGIIPFCIDLSSENEDFRRKSSRQISIMNRIYFFMFINTLILPISQTTALLFFQEITEQIHDITNWISTISINLLTQQYFYIKFIIQLTFISNGFWLIDGFHRIFAWVNKLIHD
jgi:hypothetical protein